MLRRSWKGESSIKRGWSLFRRSTRKVIAILKGIEGINISEEDPEKFPNMHLDILVELEGKWFPIELKYKTLKMNTEFSREHFNLKNHGAQDLGRYDFWVDVSRIEQLKQSIDNYEKGFMIMLSNDPSYWINPRGNKETICEYFRIHDSNDSSGTLAWVGNPSAGTIKNREKSIELNGNYRLEWSTFSTLSNARNGTFKCLILEI